MVKGSKTECRTGLRTHISSHTRRIRGRGNPNHPASNARKQAVEPYRLGNAATTFTTGLNGADTIEARLSQEEPIRA